jgi:hypothetical protein
VLSRFRTMVFRKNKARGGKRQSIRARAFGGGWTAGFGI